MPLTVLPSTSKREISVLNEENGSGKTTTQGLFSRLNEPTGGKKRAYVSIRAEFVDPMFCWLEQWHLHERKCKPTFQC